MQVKVASENSCIENDKLEISWGKLIIEIRWMVKDVDGWRRYFG
jgi:hypothetical protein